MTERLIVAAIKLLPASFINLCFGLKPVVIDGQRLHPKARLLALIDAKNAAPVTPDSVMDARARLEMAARLLSGPMPRLAAVENLTMETAKGALPARLFRPLKGGEFATSRLFPRRRLYPRLARYP